MAKAKDKEANLFNQILKLYDGKQHKKAIKLCNSLLEMNPKHGQTICMKALANLQQLEQQALLAPAPAAHPGSLSLHDEENDKMKPLMDEVKLGLRYALTSHISWHVYGIFRRACFQFEQALKCLKNAIKYDPENIQLLRELATLQIFCRDLEGYVVTKQTLLSLQSTRENWLGFSVGHFFLGNYELARAILDSYVTSINLTNLKPEENLDILFYKLRIMIKSNVPGNKILSFLEQNDISIVDMIQKNEIKAQYLLADGDSKKSLPIFEALHNGNLENVEYFTGMLWSHFVLKELDTTVFSISDGSIQVDFNLLKSGKVEKERQFIMEFATDHLKEAPKCWTYWTFLLYSSLDSDETAKQNVEKFIDIYLTKCTAALFSFLTPLYQDGNGLVGIIEKKLLSDETLWGKITLAQHYNQLGQTSQALSVLEDAVNSAGEEELDPFVYVFLAKFCLKVEKFDDACRYIRKATALDSSDRYLNTVSIKIHIAAGQIENLTELAEVFSKTKEDSRDNLSEMQAVWFSKAIVKSNLSTCMKFKHCMEILSHFKVYRNDEFDFHSFCLRKLTVNSYIGLYDWSEAIQFDKANILANLVLVECLLKVANDPEGHKRPKSNLESQIEDLTKELSSASGDEAKKIKAKLNRAIKKQNQRLEKEKEKNKPKKPSGKKRVLSPDPDPTGIDYLDKVASSPDLLEKHLAQARKNLQIILFHERIQIRNLTQKFKIISTLAEIELRRGKPLLAARALNKLKLMQLSKAEKDMSLLLKNKILQTNPEAAVLTVLEETLSHIV